MKSFKKFISEGYSGEVKDSDFFFSDDDLKDTPKRRRYQPRKFSGTKPESSYPDWVRSESNTKALLDNKITLKGVIDLFAHKNIAVSDSVTLDIPVSELYKIREYDRNIKDNSTGTNTKEEYKELLKSIKRTGIQESGVVTIERLRNGNVTAILGEGNHRLRIAKLLKLKTIPIRFKFK